MFNKSFLNFHDIAVIFFVAVIVNVMAQPLFDRIEGESDAADDDTMM